MLVGETWKDDSNDEVAAVPLVEEEAVAMAFSSALPPMAVGAVWFLLLCETHQPRPIAPAMI